MNLIEASNTILPEIENSLKKAIATHKTIIGSGMDTMLNYHLGWTGEGAGPSARGKRVRPLLMLLSAANAGGNWKEFLDVAASIELIHNFSLIHDDVEDNSQERRGRKTVWAIWGKPHAINAGDLMFSIAFTNLQSHKNTLALERLSRIQTILQETCIALTAGQYLDMEFENQDVVSKEDYWKMIEGKTASLLAACTQIGAICGGADRDVQLIYSKFGLTLGMAFQVWDDWLGIWGDEEKTGKSTQNDLLSRKKTFPVIIGLSREGAFASKWYQGRFDPNEIDRMKVLLQDEGVEKETLDTASRLTNEAMSYLAEMRTTMPEYQALVELTKFLVERSK